MTTALPDILMSSRDLVEPSLRAAVDTLDPRMRRVAGYHLGWLDAEGREQDCAGGKRLRPALALLSSQAAGAPAERGVPAATAVELVHNFSLLHDDIMDGDTERRHRPTAWTVFGVGPAILAGDALLALADEILLAQAAPSGTWAGRCLTVTVQRLIAGQSADLDFEARVDVSLQECRTMASDKTGALLSCACVLGAVLADAPPALALELAEYGNHLGLAFQIIDDLLGIWGDPQVTGKPVLADLRARKRSMPVVAALTSDTPHADALRDLYQREEPLDEDELRRAARLVELAGARDWAQREAADELALAEEHLERADLPASVEQQLRGLARFTTGRDR